MQVVRYNISSVLNNNNNEKLFLRLDLKLFKCYTKNNHGERKSFMGEETEILEIKTSTAEIPAALNSIVAMLNKHQNGTVYFGVKNNGEPVGQQMGENTVRDVTLDEIDEETLKEFIRK